MNKKKHIRELAVDNIVIAEIVEPLSDRHFIVNFDGALVRVENKSPVQLKRNQRVSLKVLSVHPLSFQLVQPEKRKRTFEVTA
jgi:hypothetical protein